MDCEAMRAPRNLSAKHFDIYTIALAMCFVLMYEARSRDTAVQSMCCRRHNGSCI